MARKRLEHQAKDQINAALKYRHTQPQLAAKHLRELLGYIGGDVVWKEISRINPNAVDELKAILRTNPAGQRAR